MTLWSAVCESIASTTGAPFVMRKVTSVGGGCINSTYVVEDGQQRYFVKVNDAHQSAMFSAEAAGLVELARPQALRIPIPIATGISGKKSFLVLECLDLGREDRKSMEKMGRGLAMLHRTFQAYFGWSRNNSIGLTPQHNPMTSDWVGFWGTHRLGYQLHLARHETYLVQRGENLLEKLASFFMDYRPRPSLVHGDLWRGNAAVTRTGEPVFFDPAVYYGDHEVDLAMTELFGGFEEGFYASYREVWPLDGGYPVRKDLYNLYHVLNHFNLFGGGYGHQAARMMDRLLAELG